MVDGNPVKGFIALLVVVAACAQLTSVSLQADDEVPQELVDLIERVEWEEQAYRNIDVTMQTRYTSRSTSPNELKEYLRQVRHVRQDDRLLLELTYSRDPQRREFEHKLLAFDGETFRFLATADDDGDLNEYRIRDHSILPHTLLQPGDNHAIPLSIWFQGQRAVRQHPQNQSNIDEYQVSRAGTGEFNGLACELVRIIGTRGTPATVSWEREYWLAVERNYIPLRVLTIEPRWSSDTPIAEGVVEEFREIEPGIWFPWRATYTLYYRVQVERTGEQRIGWQKVHETQSAIPNPGYTDGFFQDIGFDDFVLDPGAR